MNSTMEKFRKSVNICQSYGQKYRGPFLTHSVVTYEKRFHFYRRLSYIKATDLKHFCKCFILHVTRIYVEAVREDFCYNKLTKKHLRRSLM